MKTILHVSTRETLRPLRDIILRRVGFNVESVPSTEEATRLAKQRPFDLALIDVEGEGQIPQAERLCETIKKTHPKHKVAFVCNWRVAVQTDCPDEVLRTEFDPAQFLAGVQAMLASS